MASMIAPNRFVRLLRISHPVSSLAHLPTPTRNATTARLVGTNISSSRLQAPRGQTSYFTTSSGQSGPNTARPRRRGFFSGFLILGGTAFGSFVGTLYLKMTALSVTAEGAASTYKPETTEAQAMEDYINKHPLVQELRANPEMTESRPHLKLPPEWRSHSLTAGTLMGPALVGVPPFDWSETDGKSYVQIAHVGEDLCGYPGIIHGGFLATMLDEGLARCCLPAVSNTIVLTANLNIDYRAPCKANQYIVLRAKTVKVEGRKVSVEGRLETLVEPGETPLLLAEAKALFISPKGAVTASKFLPVQ
ncbi:hypothetical protein MCOR07_011173 [Pyricularia oryzae]|uniref:Thioesterase n=2 Tax=Pyricularia oryzae TaxID=318829 RepID=G4N7W1_PYRO7|nr:thioesterase [Pyricularia oryzae 70-15]KAI6314633.1 hypothetical protein MCOR29_007298 [Pyricularia oryzae]EHA50915.1 thioesterase [Pyricularia oryzae 70-15]KAI6359130.1 hypothetical protein MCOR31_009547 [Pyricularia oryzae]KAI6361844.1 hypothetical protein MCOR32_008591 [Pyricularia oryzae]KAI6416265.1 hypothetical protein MCOR21_011293 [Pyricularia oryzae]